MLSEEVMLNGEGHREHHRVERGKELGAVDISYCTNTKTSDFLVCEGFYVPAV